ncbi:MAG TPA: hypothetical protein VEQ10_10615 [Vicinamibacteria bacterium]|nr:hypothetical protein [Vicinamibacteria bacterium]
MTRSSLETTYRAMPSLGLWGPVEMKERWETRLATYSAFRRAEVSTRQEVRTPEP